MCRLRHPSLLFALPLAALLVLAPAARPQLDPAACKTAKKLLAAATKSAAFEHRVQLFDAAINFAFTIAFPLGAAQQGTSSRRISRRSATRSTASCVTCRSPRSTSPASCPTRSRRS